MKSLDELAARCAQTADRVVPEYNNGIKSYSCTGYVAKRWMGACEAFGYSPKDVEERLMEAATAKKSGKTL